MDIIEKIKIEQSPEFIDFMFAKAKELKHITTEMDVKYKDEINVSGLFNTLINMANKQNIDYDDTNDDFGFCKFSSYIKYKGDYYLGNLDVGQGSFASLSYVDSKKIKEISPNKIIYFDLENDIIEEELIEYIVINKDAVKKYNITPEKIAVHTAHAATIYAIENIDNPIFKKWYKDGNIQKKVILQASEKELKKIKYYGVEDIGYNQVPKGTLIAVSLGVMTKKQQKETPIIKRFQIFDYNKLF